MKKLVLSFLAILLLLAAAPPRAHAAFVFTLTQTGGNVVVNGSGTLNLTALSPGYTNTFAGGISPSSALLTVATTANASVYNGGGLTGPFSFGSGVNFVHASSATGSLVGVNGDSPYILVPSGYTSNTLLTDSATFADQSFATLGFTPSTYTYTWGTGANADSLTVVGVAPEPSTLAVLGIGGAGLGLVLRRCAAASHLTKERWAEDSHAWKFAMRPFFPRR